MSAIKTDLIQHSEESLQPQFAPTFFNVNMLSFTDAAEKRRRHQSTRNESEQSRHQYQPRTPTDLLFPPSALKDDDPPPTKVPRLLKKAPSFRQSKDSYKQDLHDRSFSAELDVSSGGSSRSQEATLSESSASLQNKSIDATAQSDSPLPAKDAGIDDPVWNECKARISTLEATIDSTFRPPATDSPTFIFGDEHRRAEAAFEEAKVSIRLASSRLSSHYWDRKLRADKRGALLQVQISLGQRIRRALGDAVERGEAWLDGLMRQQVELGSKEMDELLDGLDASWFEDDSEDLGLV